MNMNFKWRAQSTIYRDSIDLLGIIDYGNGEREIAKPAIFSVERAERFAAISEPTIALTPDSARSLMQALWDAGVRPEDANLSSPAEVAALKNHIRFAESVTGALLGRSPVNGDGNARSS